MKILAIGAHPDDLEINCYGTLAKYAARGDKVGVCVVSNGNLGHEEIAPDDLARIRLEEAKNAADIIGADFFFAGADDLHVDPQNEKVILELARIIRGFAPDLVITHSDRDYHSDHNETYRSVFRASFAASVGHFDPECPDPPAPSAPIYMMDNLTGVGFIPTEYVDISDYIDIKLRALACHKSQTQWMLDHDGIDFLDMAKTCSKVRGYQCGVKYAEGFRPDVNYARMSASRLLP